MIEKWIDNVNCTKVVHAGMGLAQAARNQGVSPSMWVDVTRGSLEEATFMLSLRGHMKINQTEGGNRG